MWRQSAILLIERQESGTDAKLSKCGGPRIGAVYPSIDELGAKLCGDFGATRIRVIGELSTNRPSVASLCRAGHDKAAILIAEGLESIRSFV